MLYRKLNTKKGVTSISIYLKKSFANKQNTDISERLRKEQNKFEMFGSNEIISQEISERD